MLFFVNFLSKTLPGKNSEADKITDENSDISSSEQIFPQEAKFCHKYFDKILFFGFLFSKETQMQNAFGCEKNPDTILISWNFALQKFHRFGANYVTFCICNFILAKF